MNPADVRSLASRTLVRLVFLSFFVLSTAAVAEKTYRLRLETVWILEPIFNSSSVAMTMGGAGDIFLLLDQGSRVAIFSDSGMFKGEFIANFPLPANPTDIASDGGTGVFICDPLQSTIVHMSRTGADLEPILLNTEPQFEPVTLTVLNDGRMVILNRHDGDLWRIERDGQAKPLMISSRVNNFDNARLEVTPDEEELILLESGHLRMFKLQGEPLPYPTITLSHPTGIAATNEGVWVVGNGIAFVPFTLDNSRLSYSSDSLFAWQVFPPSDIVVENDRILIASTDASRIAYIHIENVKTEQP